MFASVLSLVFRQLSQSVGWLVSAGFGCLWYAQALSIRQQHTSKSRELEQLQQLRLCRGVGVRRCWGTPSTMMRMMTRTGVQTLLWLWWVVLVDAEDVVRWVFVHSMRLYSCVGMCMNFCFHYNRSYTNTITCTTITIIFSTRAYRSADVDSYRCLCCLLSMVLSWTCVPYWLRICAYGNVFITGEFRFAVEWMNGLLKEFARKIEIDAL